MRGDPKRPPFGWREEESPEQFLFSYRETSLGSASFIAAVVAPVAGIAAYLIVSAIRDQAWLAGVVCVAPFALLSAMAVRAAVSLLIDRIRIVVTKSEIRFPNAALSLRDAAALSIKERRGTKGARYYVLVAPSSHGEPVVLDGSIDSPGRAAWVIDRLQTAANALAERALDRSGYRS